MDQIYVNINGIGHITGEIPISNEGIAQQLIKANLIKKIRASGNSITELSCEEIEKLSTTNEWVTSRSGIINRYYTAGSTSTMAAQAIRQAVTDAGRKIEDLEFILVATVTPDYLYAPPTSCLVHKQLNLAIRDELGLKNFLPVDISDACSSFGAALILGHSLIASGKARFGVVVGSDKMSSSFDPADRNFSILLGDAAAAMTLEATNDPKLDSFPWGPASFYFGTDPAGADNIKTPMGGSKQPTTLIGLNKAESTLGVARPDKLWQNGKAVFKEMINFIPEVIAHAVKRAGLELNQIKFIFPHQANLRINDNITERLKPLGFEGNVFNTIENYGNTTSAAVPLGISIAWQKYLLEPGTIIALNPFGAGYTYSCIMVRWTKEQFYFA